MLTIVLTLLAAAAITPAVVPQIGKKIFLYLAIIPTIFLTWILINWPNSTPLVDKVNWIDYLNLNLVFKLDNISAMLGSLVLGVGSLVLIYCYSYFTDTEPKLASIAAELIAFAGVMFGLVTADNLLLLFVFWELTTIFSYLLIGHKSDQIYSRRAANKAIIITSSGGLVMLVGIILLATAANSYSITDITNQSPHTPTANIGILLMLIGAFSKSAIFPFHLWLAGAMAAPTPISAYLHAAAMVKAGIYLIIRLTGIVGDAWWWNLIVFTFGAFTMIFAGWRSLREYDLKLILAFGTVSQLGFLICLACIYSYIGVLATITMLVAHALFKAALFMSVGIIEHIYHTRDVRELPNINKNHPVLFGIILISGFSMAGIPPLLGFIAKEAALTATTAFNFPLNILTLAAISVGSVLTVAYTARFIKEICNNKNSITNTSTTPSINIFLISPIILGLLTGVLSIFPNIIQTAINPYLTKLSLSDHFKLHFGLEYSYLLIITCFIILIGLLTFYQLSKTQILQNYSAKFGNADKIYYKSISLIDKIAVLITKIYQRGSLPNTLGIIFTTFTVLPLIPLLIGNKNKIHFYLTDSIYQILIGILIAAAAILTTLTKTRMTAVLLIGITGYGLIVIFAAFGAPDLALTQAIVETITLIIFSLVFRRLPLETPIKFFARWNIVRVTVALGVGITIFLLGVFSSSARNYAGVGKELFNSAVKFGHGKNAVNVTLVDIRGWDTLGEISVLIVAATGIASLVFINQRFGKAPKLSEALIQEFKTNFQAMNETVTNTTIWLKGNRVRDPKLRSIVLETLTRTIFPTMIVLSFYFFFAGHNAPGGGFAGGLIAGIAIVLRYLAGGRYEIGETLSFEAGTILGTGLLLSSGTAISSMLFNRPIFTSGFVQINLPWLGNIHLISAAIFDLGVYFIVIGLILDILRSLGVKLDNNPVTKLKTKSKV